MVTSRLVITKAEAYLLVALENLIISRNRAVESAFDGLRIYKKFHYKALLGRSSSRKLQSRVNPQSFLKASLYHPVSIPPRP